MDLDIADDRLLFIIDNDQLANFFPLPHEEWYLVRTPHGRYMVAYVRCTFLRPIRTLHNLEHACFAAMHYSRTTCRSRWLRLCCRLFRMMLSCLFLRAQDRVPTPYMILSYFRRQGISVDELDAWICCRKTNDPRSRLHLLFHVQECNWPLYFCLLLQHSSWFKVRAIMRRWMFLSLLHLVSWHGVWHHV